MQDKFNEEGLLN